MSAKPEVPSAYYIFNGSQGPDSVPIKDGGRVDFGKLGAVIVRNGELHTTYALDQNNMRLVDDKGKTVGLFGRNQMVVTQGLADMEGGANIGAILETDFLDTDGIKTSVELPEGSRIFTEKNGRIDMRLEVTPGQKSNILIHRYSEGFRADSSTRVAELELSDGYCIIGRR